MFLLLLVALAEARSDDVLVYQPLLMPSHATFMSRLIEVLADANYSVTVLVNRHREDFPHGCDKANEIISVPPVGGVLSGLTPDMGWKVKETPSSQWQAMNYLTVAHGKQCKALLNDKEVLDKLRRRKFRVLVHEVFDMCGLVLMKILNIEKHVIVSSTRQMDTVGYELGLTDPFHHAGILADYGCTFGWQSVLRNAWFIDAFLKFTDNQVNFYRDELKGLSLPTPLRRLSRSASAVFLNTHALADSWRSSLRNVHEIGGIALHKPKPLTAEMESHLKEWKKVVYISFGTVVPSAYMPDQWKKNLAAVIKSFPDVLFLWKYEVNDVFSGQKMANVIMSPFFPQNDLLHSGLLTFFITHGGQNSVLEAASAGVKLLVIPQFGDQFRNAHAVRERGLGKVLAKKDLGNFKVMQQAIESMINEETCHKNVSHLINTEAAARTFVERMEEALQSGLTFDDGPQVWDSLKIIYYIWTIMCAVAVLLGAWIVLRLYRVFAPLYSHIYTIVYPEQKS